MAPSKKCEICGETVANLKFKKHMLAHSESESNEKVEDKVEVNEAPKKQDKPIADPEMAALMEGALAMQAKILDAPDVFLGEDSSDQHEALVKVHCPESLNETSEYMAVFGDANKRLDGYTSGKAYLPILDEKGGLVRDEGGNPMFKVLREIYNGRKEVFQKQSSGRLNRFAEDAKKKEISSSGLSGEEISITKTNN